MIIDMQEAIKNKNTQPAAKPTDIKIAIKDLNLYYGAFHALHGINLDIERGKIHRAVRLRQIDAAENAQPHERPDS